MSWNVSPGNFKRIRVFFQMIGNLAYTTAVAAELKKNMGTMGTTHHNSTNHQRHHHDDHRWSSMEHDILKNGKFIYHNRQHLKSHKNKIHGTCEKVTF